MNPLDLFSPSYEVARWRFRDAARAAGATVEQHRVGTGEAGLDLTIDVARVGAREPGGAVCHVPDSSRSLRVVRQFRMVVSVRSVASK